MFFDDKIGRSLCVKCRSLTYEFIYVILHIVFCSEERREVREAVLEWYHGGQVKWTWRNCWCCCFRFVISQEFFLQVRWLYVTFLREIFRK